MEDQTTSTFLTLPSEAHFVIAKILASVDLISTTLTLVGKVNYPYVLPLYLDVIRTRALFPSLVLAGLQLEMPGHKFQWLLQHVPSSALVPTGVPLDPGTTTHGYDQYEVEYGDTWPTGSLRNYYTLNEQVESVPIVGICEPLNYAAAVGETVCLDMMLVHLDNQPLDVLFARAAGPFHFACVYSQHTSVKTLLAWLANRRGVTALAMDRIYFATDHLPAPVDLIALSVGSWKEATFCLKILKQFLDRHRAHLTVTDNPAEGTPEEYGDKPPTALHVAATNVVPVDFLEVLLSMNLYNPLSVTRRITANKSTVWNESSLSLACRTNRNCLIIFKLLVHHGKGLKHVTNPHALRITKVALHNAIREPQFWVEKFMFLVESFTRPGVTKALTTTVISAPGRVSAARVGLWDQFMLSLNGIDWNRPVQHLMHVAAVLASRSAEDTEVNHLQTVSYVINTPLHYFVIFVIQNREDIESLENMRQVNLVNDVCKSILELLLLAGADPNVPYGAGSSLNSDDDMKFVPSEKSKPIEIAKANREKGLMKVLLQYGKLPLTQERREERMARFYRKFGELPSWVKE